MSPPEDPNDRLSFWRSWLLLALGAQGLGGYAVAFAYAVLPGLGWHRSGTAQALWSRDEFPADVEPFRDFIMGVLGATIASWSVALIFVVAIPFARRERWAWWCVTISVLSWFPFDTGLSLAHGVTVNALFNLAAVVMMAIPLAATWRMALPAR
ncbi:MAG: hypothetical protein KC431_06185 [Myxococcales bacterium]|nr:hypothetical protein [Myxococcales bacterium]